MDRLTTDNPNDNLSTLLNFAYAKDHRVVLSFADDKKDHDLCEYVALNALRNGCIFTPEEVMDGACSECDCSMAVLYNTATQAAELRARLKMIEDILGDTYDLDHLRELVEADREGRLIEHPGKELCEKQGDYIYIIDDGEAVEAILCTVGFDEEGNDYILSIYGTPGDEDYGTINRRFSDVGKTVFFTSEAAETAIAKMEDD